MVSNPGPTDIDPMAAALRRDPGNAALLADLGNALGRHGRIDEAIVCLQRAVAIDPKLVAAQANLGVALSMRKRTAEAIAVFRAALRVSPNEAVLHANLATALREQGNLADAVEGYRRAISLDPDSDLAAQTHRNLSDVLIELGRPDEAFAHDMRFAALEYGRWRPAPGVMPPHKALHDREQLDYMIAAGIADAARLGDRANSPDPFNGFFHIEGGQRLAGAAVNPGNDTADVEARWAESKPQVVVVDDLLTPEALASAGASAGARPSGGRRMPTAISARFPRAASPRRCWRRSPRNCASISRAFSARSPAPAFWAFKYDSRLKGINVHADFAAVNVNFWITPDEANLDPEHGGLVIWDVPAPLDWDFDKYNADAQAIRDFLVAAQRDFGHGSAIAPTAPSIFDSDLFHETDRIAFKEGYTNRRINVTLLYGLRENSAVAP